jgi:hypothetical protein
MVPPDPSVPQPPGAGEQTPASPCVLQVSEFALAISGRPCGPAHSPSHHGAPRLGVISKLASPGPGGPQFARRWALRPRWSRPPGGREDAGHVTSNSPSPAGPSAGSGSTAGTVRSRCHNEGGMRRSCRPRLLERRTNGLPDLLVVPRSGSLLSACVLHACLLL